MARKVMFDQIRLTLLVPVDMSRKDASATRKTLDDPRFRAVLRRSIRTVLDRFLGIKTVWFRLSR